MAAFIFLFLAAAAAEEGKEDNAAAAEEARLRAEMAQTGRGLFFSGRYDEALARCADKSDAETLALRADILMENGRAEEAIRLLAGAAAGDDPLLLACRGEAYVQCGEYEKADADFRAAMAHWGDPPAAGQVRAKLARSRLLWDLGRRDEAEEEVDWFFDFYATCDNQALSAEMAVAIGCAAVLVDTPDNYKEGLKVVALAQRKDKTFLPAFVRAGEIFLAKYQYEDAEGEFRAALRLNPRHPEANTGLAAVKILQGDFASAEASARQALATNPRYIPALLLLAELEFVDERLENSLAYCAEALRINPHHPAALLWQAALWYFSGDAERFRQAQEEAVALGDCLPFADEEARAASRRVLQARLGHLLCQMLNSRYRLPEALTFARAAVEADPDNALAQADLGICLMRQGLEDEAAPVLATASRLDPFNVWVYNLRKLLERRKEYAEIKGQRFIVQIHRRDEPALAEYAPAWAEEHLRWCENTFGHKVDGQLRLAILKAQADFAARVTGLPRLDASGASFGAFIALVSPAAMLENGRPVNLEIVLRHEIAHTVTIFASKHRLPRWLAEGLSVYAQGWDDPAYDIPFATMVNRGELPTFETWNRFFHRPRYPWEMPAAYAAAGIFVAWVAKEYGEAALAKALAAYGADKPAAAIWQEITGHTLEELNEILHRQLRMRSQALQPEILEDVSRLTEYEKACAERPADSLAALRLLRALRLAQPAKAYALAERLAAAALAQPPAKGDEAAFALAACVTAEKAILDRQWEKASQMAELARRLQPDSALAHLSLGIARLQTGARQEAESCWREAIRLYPRFVHGTAIGNPYEALLRLWEEDGKRDEIISLLASYIAIRRDDAGAIRRLAEAAAAAGKRDVALQAYRGLIAVDPYRRADHERYA
ncbi:MAG: tetratricopeptide repeat protein, partial [Planctomycetota bacterium]|nr:tetratricopeptide repeat protein [Planctomycetota bacterium]